MNSLFYINLARQNIKNNRKFYLPYILTGILTVAMFYNVMFLASSQAISMMPGAATVSVVMGLGVFIVALFALIFLFYTNSFLIKRRKKEFGLYHVLGMEKRHISVILFWECILVSGSTIILGLVAGILLSKFLLLLLFKLLFFSTHFGFQVSSFAVTVTAILFAAIYTLILLFNLRQVKKSNAMELLQAGNSGEREPKTKWFLSLAGFLTLGGGYYIALCTDSPMHAVYLFFIAVILVIIGTYCLFTAGSIAVLKLLRKNKKFYYQSSHFTTVSGMIYRMKQNAVGLANICILCTMVLVMISTTVCMYAGTENTLNTMYPRDIVYSATTESLDSPLAFIGPVAEAEAAQEGLTLENNLIYSMLSLDVSVEGNRLDASTGNVFLAGEGYGIASIMTVANYNRLTGQQLVLPADAVYLLAPDSFPRAEQICLLGETFQVAGWLDSFPIADSYVEGMVAQYDVLVADDAVLKNLYATLPNAGDSFTHIYAFDLTGSDEQIISCYQQIEQLVYGNEETGTAVRSIHSQCRQLAGKDYYALYGGFLFLGIFLGLLFLMATVLIIYYKQICEGYDDKERFEIMQKVGMSRAEVKRSIRSQVVIVFLLPLLAAFVHLLFAFKIITKMLMLLTSLNIPLFTLCMLVTSVVFALVYACVYLWTSKAYYNLVSFH